MARKMKDRNKDGHKVIHKETWIVFEMWLEQAIDYFEGYENLDFEQCTLRDQLRSILNHYGEDP